MTQQQFLVRGFSITPIAFFLTSSINVFNSPDKSLLQIVRIFAETLIFNLYLIANFCLELSMLQPMFQQENLKLGLPIFGFLVDHKIKHSTSCSINFENLGYLNSYYDRT